MEWHESVSRLMEENSCILEKPHSAGEQESEVVYS